MMANDWQRLNIWLQLANKFDYNEYVTSCAVAGAQAHSAHEFAQKAGMVMAGMAMYPELPVAEAYLSFVRNHQQAFAPISTQTTQQTPVNSLAPNELPPGLKKEKVTITFADGTTKESDMVIPDGTQKSSCCGGGTVK